MSLEGRTFLEQALASGSGVGASIRAKALSGAAELAFVQDDYERVEILCRESLALYRELGDAWHSALPLSLLGEIHLVQGEWTLARERLEESVALSQEAGNQRGAAEALMSLARVALAQDDLAAALHGYQECLALLHKIDYLGFLPDCLEGLGAVVARQEVPLKAAEVWGAAEALREAIGTPMHPVYRADYEQAVAAARTQLGERAFAKAWAEGRATPLKQVITDVLEKDGGAGVQ